MKNILILLCVMICFNIQSQTLEIKLAKPRQYNGQFEVRTTGSLPLMNVKVLEFTQKKTYDRFLFTFKKTKLTNGVYFYELQASAALTDFATPTNYSWTSGEINKIIIIADPK